MEKFAEKLCRNPHDIVDYDDGIHYFSLDFRWWCWTVALVNTVSGRYWTVTVENEPVTVKKVQECMATLLAKMAAFSQEQECTL